MLKIILCTTKNISILIATVMILWLSVVTIFIIGNGGQYSIFVDGAIICGIPIFTEERWLWTLFELYGMPLMMIIASWRTINYCAERLRR